MTKQVKRFEGDESRISCVVEFITVTSYDSWGDVFRKTAIILDKQKDFMLQNIKIEESAEGKQIKLALLKDIIADKDLKKNILFLREVAEL